MRIKKKNKKILLSFLILIAVFIVISLVRLLSGPEDEWLCAQGKWVKHGNPSAPMPATDCLK